MEKEYLGDSVYIEIISGDVVLTTNNGLGSTNTIYLEHEVLNKLLNYIERMKCIKDI